MLIVPASKVPPEGIMRILSSVFDSDADPA